jgi:RNA polymerase sigma factor (sigma-70 family)
MLPLVIGADYFIEMNGSDLLSEYRNTASEGAFSELVRRYTNLIYSIAKRRLSNGPLAEEVTQTVFTRLAKAMPKVKGDAELVAWLHRTTIHVAIDVWRSETRRRTREQNVAIMEPPESAQLWDEIAPNLDEALNQLSDADRQAVLLRYFDRKPMRDIGRILGVSEDAAKMRLSRAIDRLRTQLKLRGVTCAAGTLSGLLAERSLEAAPSQLVATLSSTKFAGGAATTLSALSFLMILISKSKLATALIVIAAVGIGVIGTLRIMDTGTSSSRSINVVRGAQDLVNTAPPSRPAIGRGAGNDGAAEPARSPDIAELDDLKRQLRALLQNPPAGNSYPPPELTRLLTKFGAQLHEAAPILLEALSVQDYETRAWALSGLGHALYLLRTTQGLEAQAEPVFALARPVLSKILASPNEPQMLRLLAVDSYLPPIAFDVNGAAINPPGPLTTEYTEDLLAALRTQDKHSGGIRFRIVNRLAEHFGRHPDDVAKFVSALHPLLSDSDPHERLLAAFALGSWPGEKPSAVKDVLSAELKARTTDHSYLAAQGLGKLGAQAADAVPDLLAYAEAIKGSDAGYARSALEAACRIQPDLRSQYPDIDEKLKQEESTSTQPGEIRVTDFRVVSPGELAAKLADAAERAALVEGLVSSIKGSSEPEKTKESFLTQLEQMFVNAPENQRVAIQNVIHAVRQTDSSIKSEETRRRPVAMASLALDARIMLVDSDNPNRDKLENILNEFQIQYLQKGGDGGDANVTTERYRALSETIRGIDPEFQTRWRKQVLKNYPWLDRVMPPEQE